MNKTIIGYNGVCLTSLLYFQDMDLIEGVTFDEYEKIFVINRGDNERITEEISKYFEHLSKSTLLDLAYDLVKEWIEKRSLYKTIVGLRPDNVLIPVGATWYPNMIDRLNTKKYKKVFAGRKAPEVVAEIREYLFEEGFVDTEVNDIIETFKRSVMEKLV